MIALLQAAGAGYALCRSIDTALAKEKGSAIYFGVALLLAVMALAAR